tara:strand:- start:258 stop:1163 length:906 start_codon:yes stop_codon:yes gene_type:complete
MKLKKQLVMMNMSDLRFICKELSISCPEKKSDIINKLLQPLTNKYRFYGPGGPGSGYNELMNRFSTANSTADFSTANDSAISYDSDDKIDIHDINIDRYLNRMKELEQMLDEIHFCFNPEPDLAEYWLKNATSESKYWMKQLYIWDLVDKKIKRWKTFCDNKKYTSGTQTVKRFLPWDKYAKKLAKTWYSDTFTVNLSGNNKYENSFIDQLVDQEKERIKNFCVKEEYLKKPENIDDKIPKDFVQEIINLKQKSMSGIVEEENFLSLLLISGVIDKYINIKEIIDSALGEDIIELLLNILT